jgi:hypothetical protein
MKKTTVIAPGNTIPSCHGTILANAKDEDLKAIYAYLRTIKPVTNKVEKWPK